METHKRESKGCIVALAFGITCLVLVVALLPRTLLYPKHPRFYVRAMRMPGVYALNGSQFENMPGEVYLRYHNPNILFDVNMYDVTFRLLYHESCITQNAPFSVPLKPRKIVYDYAIFNNFLTPHFDAIRLLERSGFTEKAEYLSMKRDIQMYQKLTFDIELALRVEYVLGSWWHMKAWDSVMVRCSNATINIPDDRECASDEDNKLLDPPCWRDNLLAVTPVLCTVLSRTRITN